LLAQTFLIYSDSHNCLHARRTLFFIVCLFCGKKRKKRKKEEEEEEEEEKKKQKQKQKKKKKKKKKICAYNHVCCVHAKLGSPPSWRYEPARINPN